jgi:hypothetical protein
MRADARVAALGTGAARPDGVRDASLSDRIALIPVVASAFSKRRTNRWTHPAWWMVYAFGALVDMIIKSALCDSGRKAVVCWARAESRRETAAGIVIGTTIAGVVVVALVTTRAGHVLATIAWPQTVGLLTLLFGALLLTIRRWRRRAPLAARRPGDAWFVSSVSSDVRGAGALVLNELCHRADDSGRRLCLDVVVGPLTERYYPRFGFQPDGEPVDVGGGRRRLVMVRQSTGEPRREGSSGTSS